MLTGESISFRYGDENNSMILRAHSKSAHEPIVFAKNLSGSTQNVITVFD